MDFNQISDIKANNFLGFKTIEELHENSSSISLAKGVYLVLYLTKETPEYLITGSGPKYYKGKINPNVSIAVLESNWVKDTVVVYIGKAGGKNKLGLEIQETLRSRLRKYLSFGRGNDIGHYGGRLIWQLKHSDNLVICWKTTPEQEPAQVESNLIQEFKYYYNNQRPFANLKD